MRTTNGQREGLFSYSIAGSRKHSRKDLELFLNIEEVCTLIPPENKENVKLYNSCID